VAKIFLKIASKFKILAIVLALIIAGSIFSYVYVNYNFVLSEELAIKLEPGFKIITLNQGESETINFDYQISNHWLCKSTCSVEFKSLSFNEVLYRETFEVDKVLRETFSYDITPSISGEGSELYGFRVSCKNEATNICVTTSQNLTRDGLVVLSYKLNEGQIILRDELNNTLNNLISEYNLERNSYEYLINSSLDLIAFDLSSYSTYLEELENSFNLALNLFENQSFNNIIVPSVDIKSRAYVQKLDEAIERYNEIVEFYNLFDLNKFVLNGRIQGNITTLENALIELENLDRLLKNKARIELIEISYQRTLDSLNVVNDLDEDLFIDYSIALKSHNFSLTPSRDNVCENIDIILSQNHSFDLETFNFIVYNVSSQYNNSKSQRYLAGLNVNESFEVTMQTSVNSTIFNSLLLINESCKEELNVYNKTILDNLSFVSLNNTNFLSFKESKSVCCVNGECSFCCENNECVDKRPLILLHGHSFSKANSPDYSTDSFNSLKNSLIKDGYVKGNIISPGQTTSFEQVGSLAKFNSSFVFKSTYYSLTLFDDLGYITSISKSENIDAYAIRLKNIIDHTKITTGRDKVDVVAHSMGGLVLRRYIQIFGDSSIENAILVGTPNHGISDRVYGLCTLFGPNKECDDMKQNSLFIRNINDPRNMHPNQRLHIIRAEGCDMPEGNGDGVIVSNSVYLENQHNYLINGECQGTLTLHTRMLNPTAYPEVYEIIKSILNKNN
jgi:hypothetical protein